LERFLHRCGRAVSGKLTCPCGACGSWESPPSHLCHGHDSLCMWNSMRDSHFLLPNVYDTTSASGGKMFSDSHHGRELSDLGSWDNDMSNQWS
jgi:hypothetical protein